MMLQELRHLRGGGRGEGTPWGVGGGVGDHGAALWPARSAWPGIGEFVCVLLSTFRTVQYMMYTTFKLHTDATVVERGGVSVALIFPRRNLIINHTLR